jgi:hypothetical protein
MHVYTATPADTVLTIQTPLFTGFRALFTGQFDDVLPAWRQVQWTWAAGYAIMAWLFALAPLVTVRHDGAGHS